MVPVEGLTHNYEEELTVQTTIADKAKERYEQAKADVDKQKEQATEREVELQKLLDTWTTQLQAIEHKAATTLKATDILPHN